MGHRIAKHIYNNDNVLEKSTYYILDAQGNTMATYDRVNDPVEMEISFIQSEKYIYGNSRLGVYNDSVPMLGSQNNHEIVDRSLPLDTIIMNVSAAYDSLCLPDAVGKWWFDHSGTTGTVSGQVATFSDNNSSDDWMSVQVSANATPGQTYTLSFDLTGQTNLSYNSVEIRNCSGGGIFDYPLYSDGSYRFTFTIPDDWSGKVRIKWWSYEANGAIPMGYSLANISLDGAGVQFSNDEEYAEEPLWADVVGKRNYELNNHLGNVLSVISDKVIPADGITTVYENHFDNIPDNFIYENDFSSSLDGFYPYNGASTASLSSGRLEADFDIYGLVGIDLPTTAGHKYIVSYDVELDTVRVTYGIAAESITGTVLGGQYQEFAGTYHYLVEATTSSTTFYFYAQDHGTPHTLYLDDFTVNDVTGNTNYDPFFGSYSVSLSIEGNRLKAEHIAVWTQPSMILPTVSGHTYRATATLDLESGSYIDFVAFNSTGGSINGVWASSDGTYSFDFTATSSTSRIDFQNPLSGDWTLYIDDFKIEDITTSVAYMADIRQSTDYSPFGVQLSGRNFTASAVSKKYRMGYQGSEMDNEVKGEGNSYTTEYRFLDPRLGRWLTLDPVVQPWQSPYCSMDNNPIFYFDVLGLYSKDVADKKAKRAEKHGYKAYAIQNDDGNWAVSYSKRNKSNTGTYFLTQSHGIFHGIGKAGLVMDNESYSSPILSDENKVFVALLNAPNGAKGNGHNALMIGNNIDGWIFISKEGRVDGNGNPISGGKALPARKAEFSTLEELAKDKDFDEYKNAAIFKIKVSDQDKVIHEMNKRAYAKYSLLTANCGHACTGALEKGGLNVHQFVQTTVSDGKGGFYTVTDDVGNTPIPNDSFKFLIRNNKSHLVSKTKI